MIDPFYGQIVACAFNWAPQGFLPCDGRSLPVQYYQALFAVISPYFGYNANITQFYLPDLRNRMTIGAGVAAYGTTYKMAQTGFGNSSYIPLLQHTHTLTVSLPVADYDDTTAQTTPVGNFYAVADDNYYATQPETGVAMVSMFTNVDAAGTNSPFPVSFQTPYIQMLYCIACDYALFPVRPS